ncbi:MAG: hypothetical protein ACPGWS_07170 [Solirubrobacterales bacterium]
MNEQPNSPQHGENAGPEVPVPPPAVGQQAYYLPVGQAPPPGARPVPAGQVPGQPKQSNDAAVASIIVACSSIGLLFLTAGLAAPITAIASTIAAFLGHKGKDDVDNGKTTAQRDLAVAGFWTGIGGVIISVVALIIWVAVIVILAGSESFWDEIDREFNTSGSFD